MSKVKVYRTTEGTLFEAVSGIAMAVSLGIIFHHLQPNAIYYALGAWGIFACLSTLMLWLAYHPDSAYIRMSVESDPDNDIQMALVCRLMRILGIFLAILLLISTLAFFFHRNSFYTILVAFAAPTLIGMTNHIIRKIKEAAEIHKPKN